MLRTEMRNEKTMHLDQMSPEEICRAMNYENMVSVRAVEAVLPQVARAIDVAVPSKRVGVAVLGMEVPHVHVHLIPMNSEKDMVISNPKLKLEASEMAEIAANIASKF